MPSDDARGAEDAPYLSVVIPAYNEAARLPATLRAVLAFLQRQPYRAEVIVVDDGSTDDTAHVAAAMLAEAPGRVLREPHRGKGAAVRAGIGAARGETILFTDADLAVPIDEAGRLLRAVADGYAVVIGSREGAGAAREGEPAFRHLMGRVFNRIVQWLAVPGINDTQCGFKVFRSDAAQAIMPRQRLYGPDAPIVHGARVTGFDVEMLVIARRQGFRIREEPVHWRYGEQSKVRPLADTFWNVRDVLRVRLNDWRGYYR